MPRPETRLSEWSEWGDLRTHHSRIQTAHLRDLFADDRILNVAHAFQRETDWHLRRPDMEAVLAAG